MKTRKYHYRPKQKNLKRKLEPIKKITPHHTLALVFEPWQTNIYHLQGFYQINQIWNMKHNFSYILVSQKGHIKLINPIWKQSNMYFLNFSIIILLLVWSMMEKREKTNIPLYYQYANDQQVYPNLLVCIPLVRCSLPMLCFLNEVYNAVSSA